jgi:hypothetical protein
MTVHPPKNGRTRTVHLDVQTVAVLREHRRRQLEERLAASSWGALDYVFVNAAEPPMVRLQQSTTGVGLLISPSTRRVPKRAMQLRSRRLRRCRPRVRP